MNNQPIYVVQPLEVIVTDYSQDTVASNEQQITVQLNVPESTSEYDKLSNITNYYNIKQLLLYILCVLLLQLYQPVSKFLHRRRTRYKIIKPTWELRCSNICPC